MVEMSQRNQTKVFCGIELFQQVDERDGVRPTRQRGHDSRVAAGEMVALDGPPYAIEELHSTRGATLPRAWFRHDN